MAEKFSKLMADTKLVVQEEAQRTSDKINTKPTPRHITFKPQKSKDRENRERSQRVQKHLTYTAGG